MSRSSSQVLVLGLNYPPEPTGISPYTGAIARGLVRRDVETRALTAHPHYPDWKVTPGYGQWSKLENLDGVQVRRLRHYIPRNPTGIRRAASEMSFGLRQSFARWGEPDAVIAVSPALISTWVTMLRARVTHRHTPLVVWVQDLYSLGLSETGQGGGMVHRAMKLIEGSVLRHATRVVVIHERFARRVADDFGIPRDRIEVVRNWTHLPPTPVTDTRATRRALGWSDDETVILHAGNMGVKQGLDNVIAAARLADAASAPVRFVLLGGGSQREMLRALADGVTRVQFLDSLPDDEYAAAMQSADVLLVNEKPGVAEMAVPSKLTSYFNSGKPVVAATDLSGITAEELRAAGAGIVVPAGDPNSLLEAAMELARNPAVARSLGESGLRYRHTVLDEETALDRFTEILAAVVAERATSSGDHPTAPAVRIERSTT
ncbi:glycosyltransferase family 4 protein [Microbacterium sp. NPDC058062]|uniref:glycosyltransferase family 4 protein n=1 Tax=Microbacterium sp. NPDC058062 TaxID=3346320 RepID=UPI0036DD679F